MTSDDKVHSHTWFEVQVLCVVMTAASLLNVEACV